MPGESPHLCTREKKLLGGDFCDTYQKKCYLEIQHAKIEIARYLVTKMFFDFDEPKIVGKLVARYETNCPMYLFFRVV